MLENWGLTAKGLTPVRTVWKVVTDRGVFCLKPVDREAPKVRFIAAAMQHLSRRGFRKMANALPTRQGELFVTARADMHYMLTDWIAGVEPDYRDPVHIGAAARTLAQFHLASSGFSPPEGAGSRHRLGRWPDRLAERRDRLLFYRTEVSKKSKPSSFDRLFLDHADWISERTRRAIEMLSSSAYGRLVEAAEADNPLCHGDVAVRNFVFTPAQEVYLIDFDYIAIDLPVIDLWRLLRRTLRRGWEIDSARLILRSYSAVRPLDPGEIGVLRALLTFPDKAWEAARKHYDRREGRESERTAKLRRAVAQIKEIEAFGRAFEEAFGT